jgi:K+/H+ antiporter YhaU regulatory subunit KhtT
VAVRRRGELIAHPDPRVAFEPGDIVYLVGSLPSIEQAMVRARGPGRGGAT